MIYPKISIVTPSFNQGKYLEQTILSILNQKYPNLEYIIIDGGSTDNSLEIIKKYKNELHYWVSEKDKGQSDAINKGLKKISGKLFNWINSDDFLEDSALFKIAEAYNNNTDKTVFCFGINYLKGKKKIPFNLQNNTSDLIQCLCTPVISQPSTFYSIESVKCFKEINPYLHYSMDYEWWLKQIFFFGCNSIYLGASHIATFRVHDEAKTSSGLNNFSNDIATILFSLCRQTQNDKYAALLAEVCSVNKKYHFDINEHSIDGNLVERMTISFLLKWKHKVYSRNDFLTVKKITRNISINAAKLSEQEKTWHKEMLLNAKPVSWLEFRAKRKIHHLLSVK